MRRVALPLSMAIAMVAAAPALAGGGMPKLADLHAGPHSVTLHNDSPRLGTGHNLLTVEIPTLPGDHSVGLHLEGPHGQVVEVPLRKLIVLDGPADAHGGGQDDHGDDRADGGNDDHTAGTDDHTAARDDHAVAKNDHTTGKDDHGTTAAPNVLKPSQIRAAAQTVKQDDAHAAKSEPAPAHAAESKASSGHGESDAHGASAAPAPASTAGADDHASATLSDDHGSAERENGGYVGRGSARLDATGTWKARLLIRDPNGEVMTAEMALDVVDGGPNPIYLGTTGLLIGGSLLYGATQRRRQPNGRK